jgi:hypothetical protein
MRSKETITEIDGWMILIGEDEDAPYAWAIGADGRDYDLIIASHLRRPAMGSVDGCHYQAPNAARLELFLRRLASRRLLTAEGSIQGLPGSSSLGAVFC